MMQQPAAGDLGRAFRVSTGSAAYQQFLMRQREEERLRRDRADDISSDELTNLAGAIVSASEIADFEIELNSYDTATIAALQANEIKLTEVREQIGPLLGQAYVLPDGRRVFKTESGLRVFDENGNEVDASTVDPHDINDALPRWEQYKPALDNFQTLTAERTELLDYQAKLDEAHERLDAGDMTRKEFDDLRNELKADMPDAVRAQLPDPTNDADAAPDIASPQADTLDVQSDMVPTAFAAKTSVPGLHG